MVREQAAREKAERDARLEQAMVDADACVTAPPIADGQETHWPLSDSLALRIGADCDVYRYYVDQDELSLERVALTSGARATPLAYGVAGMALLYGEDTDADGVLNRWLTADQVVDWRRLVAVEITLLGQSEPIVLGTIGASTQTFNGADVDLSTSAFYRRLARTVYYW